MIMNRASVVNTRGLKSGEKLPQPTRQDVGVKPACLSQKRNGFRPNGSPGPNASPFKIKQAALRLHSLSLQGHIYGGPETQISQLVCSPPQVFPE